MSSKDRHPEREILEFINGTLSGLSREAVEVHLAQCSKCAAVAAVVSALKKQARTPSGPEGEFGNKGPSQSSPVAYGSLLPSPGGPGGVSTHGPSPAGSKDLEFNDLLQEADVSRPALNRGMGDARPTLESIARDSSAHLHAADLASFFYGELPKEAAAAAACHVAICADCASAISLYADSDATANAGDQSTSPGSKMSEENWRLINEWEENCLANPRPENEAPNREMLERFIEILREHKEEIERVASGRNHPLEIGTGAHQIVPVVVLDSSGGFRGVEPFQRISRPRGLEALQSQAPPNRFNNLPIHALLGAERKYPMVVSGRISRGCAELDYGSVKTGLVQPVGYFIVEN